ncbi:MAG: ABC transporter permease [Gammaproteobacteria bacterium]|nr:ABC transporter permease [Gammaproteobacteria bacterium]
MKQLHKLTKDFEIIKVLTKNALKIKYKRSKLGLIWSVLNPIFNIVVISFVFSRFSGTSFSKFVIFFFSGYLAWSFFSNSVLGATNSFIANESLIKKAPINLLIFPIVTIAVSFVEFMLSIFTLTIIALLFGMKITPALLIMPYAILALLAFTIGLALIVSVITAFFRDMVHIFSVFMQMWFYLTPVLYSKHILAGKASFLLYINPMAYYIDSFRQPVNNGDLPSLFTLLMMAVFAAASLLIGTMVFKKYRSRIIFGL